MCSRPPRRRARAPNRRSASPMPSQATRTARLRDDVKKADLGAVVSAPQLYLDAPAVGLALVDDRSRPQPRVAPLGQRDDDRFQRQPALGQQVFALLTRVSELPTLHEADFDETVQAPREDVRGDPQTALELREACAVTEHRVTQDEQTPALTHQLERARSRAVLTLVETSKHVHTIRA